MLLIELEDNTIIICESKKQYGFEKDYELFTYKNYIELDISFKEALKNKEILKKCFPLLRGDDLCGGKPIKEKKL